MTTPTKTLTFKLVDYFKPNACYLIDRDDLRLVKERDEIVATADDVLSGCKSLIGSMAMSGSIAAGLDDFSPYVRSQSTLLIPVSGVLVPNCSICIPNFVTGYEYIRSMLERAVDDPYVNSAALIINSPGGVAQGCFELANFISSLSGSLRVEAFVKHNACSAAYAIAASCQRVTASPSAMVGSIGVICEYFDMSEYYKDAGIKVVPIIAPEGGHKADGAPYAALTQDAQDRIQQSVNYTYNQFVSCVANGRGLQRETIIATQADVFTPDVALEKNLIDDVLVIDDILMDFIADVENFKGVKDMKDDEKSAVSKDTVGETVAKSATVVKEDVKASSAKTDKDLYASGYQAGMQAGTLAAAKLERERISTILGSDEGKARPSAANALAMNTDLAAADIVGLLKTMPVEQAAVKLETTQADHFAAAVRNSAPMLEAGADNTALMTPEQKADAEIKELMALSKTFGTK